MGDRNWITNNPLTWLQTDKENELDHKREVERRDAKALAFDAIAYQTMPEDLRRRAREWGVEAIMCAVWNSGFHNGYLQAERDRKAVEPRAEQ